MAKKTYIGVNGKAKQAKQVYVPENQYLGRKIKKIYVGINGKAKQVYERAITNTSASVTTKTTTLSTSLTIKGLCYGGGYWAAVANDSSNDLYFIYSTSPTGTWTTKKLATGRAYPATGVAYIDTYDGYVVSCTSGGYSNRNVILVPKATMTGSSTGYTYFANGATYSWECIASANGLFFIGGTNITNGNAGGQMSITAGSPGSSGKTFTLASTIGEGHIFDVCAHKGFFAFLATNKIGYMKQGDASYTGYTNEFAVNLTWHCIASMGDFLVIAGTRSDGTYIYYTKSNATTTDNWSTAIWACQKISSTVYNPEALAYVNGKCVLAYEYNGNMYFATATSPDQYWTLSSSPAQMGAGSFVTMVHGNNQGCSIVNNGTKIVTGNITISSSALMTFYIDGTTYQAEEGMTWGEWVESDYNSEAWYFEEVLLPDRQKFILIWGLAPDIYLNVSPEDVIQSNYDYETSWI